MARRRHVQARALLARTLPHWPDDPDLLHGAAWLDYHEERYAEAEQGALQLLAQDPHSEGARGLLADVYEATGDSERAEAMYRSLLADFPEDVHYLACYSLLLVNTVHLNRASELAEKAMSLNPEHPLALRASVFAALCRGDDATVDARLEDLVAQDPDAQSTLASVADVLHERGRYREALNILRELLRLDPANERLVTLVVELRRDAHWSMVPLRPFQRLGYTEGLSAIALAGFGTLHLGTSPASRAVGLGTLAFALYGAVWPRLLKALIAR